MSYRNAILCSSLSSSCCPSCAPFQQRLLQPHHCKGGRNNALVPIAPLHTNHFSASFESRIVRNCISLLLLLVVGLDVATGNADITSVHARSESEKAHVTNHTHHAESHVSPQAAKALPERLWRVCDVEEHEGLGAFAAQAAR